MSGSFDLLGDFWAFLFRTAGKGDWVLFAFGRYILGGMILLGRGIGYEGENLAFSAFPPFWASFAANLVISIAGFSPGKFSEKST